MKHLYCSFLLLLCLLATAQKHVNAEWEKQINEVFGGLDFSKVPKGILLDYAMEFTNVQAYNGTITDSTAINAGVMSSIYKTLFMGKVTPDTTYFPRMETYARDWAVKRKSYNDSVQNTLVLGGLLYEYAMIDSTALTKGKIKVEGDKYFDVYNDGVWEDPYQMGTTAAISSPLDNYNLLDFYVVLPEALFLTNMPGSIEKIEADFDDGEGYRTLPFGQKINVSYDGPGKYKWKFRIMLNDSRELDLQHMIIIGDGAYILGPPVVHIPYPASGPNAFGKAGAILSFDDNFFPGTPLTRPLIVVEGFDTGSITSPEKFGGDRTLRHFMRDVAFEFEVGDLEDLLDIDNANGYQVIYVDWKNGTAAIQDNAEVLKSVIKWVNDHKEGNEPNVILGQEHGRAYNTLCPC